LSAIAGTVRVIKSLLVSFSDVIFSMVNRSKRWSTRFCHSEACEHVIFGYSPQCMLDIVEQDCNPNYLL
jgi:hypothetical protein